MTTQTREQRLIDTLKYLETPLCRSIMPEEERRKELQRVTDEFRNVLRNKDIMRQYVKGIPTDIYTVRMDSDIYG